MRHNKMAGTGFLLCSRKKRASRNTAKLTTFTASGDFTDCKRRVLGGNLLHSKSTYFYNKFSSKRLGGGDLSTSLTYLAPFCCGVALVLGIAIINPVASRLMVLAATDPDVCQNGNTDTITCAMELGIMMNNTNNTFTEVPATILSTTEATFRDYSFSVRAVDTKDGYKLYANAISITGADGIDYTNQLVNMDDPENSTIMPIEATSGIEGSNIPAGQWGYAFTKGNNTATAPDTLTYKAVPTGTTESAQPIDTGTDTIYDSTTGTHTDMNYKLYFGARAGDGMRSGHYRTQVQLSLVADPKTVLGKTMQGFTAQACSAMSVGDSKQLVDNRIESGAGQKTYWIAKFNDGNCWMTQNLDLDIPANGLKASDTNIISDWNPGAPTLTTQSNWSSSRDAIQSFDPGSYIYVNPSNTEWLACDFLSSSCSAWKKLNDDWKPTSDISFDNELTSSINIADKTYDARYLVGNYYSFAAATAGNTTNSQTNTDICPKGWHLPIKEGNNSYKNMLTMQGIQSDKNNAGYYIPLISQPPVSMFPAGYYDGTVRGAGEIGNYLGAQPGDYWSLNFYFDSSSFSPGLGHSGDSRQQGNSVRCLISGS